MHATKAWVQAYVHCVSHPPVTRAQLQMLHAGLPGVLCVMLRRRRSSFQRHRPWHATLLCCTIIRDAARLTRCGAHELLNSTAFVGQFVAGLPMRALCACAVVVLGRCWGLDRDWRCFAAACLAAAGLRPLERAAFAAAGFTAASDCAPCIACQASVPRCPDEERLIWRGHPSQLTSLQLLSLHQASGTGCS